MSFEVSYSFRSQEDITGKDQVEASVLVTARPDCGEATVVSPWVASGYVPLGPDRGGNMRGWTPKRTDKRWAEALEANVQRHRAKDLARAQGRAKKMLRQFVVQNLLMRMWSFTCADQTHDRSLMVRRMNQFTGRLREELGESFPYVYVLEQHQSGAWHVHLLMDRRFIAKGTMERLWSHGLVHYSDGKRSGKMSSRERCRRAAEYVSKYVTKDWDIEAQAGQHRYERSNGFGVRVVRSRAVSMGAGIMYVIGEVAGTHHVEMWDSATCPEWDGPPCVVLRW